MTHELISKRWRFFNYMKTKTATHAYEVGDILHCGWGWSMTLNTFYQVVGTTSKTITIRLLKQKDEGGWPVGESTPLKGDFENDRDTSFPLQKRCTVRPDGWVRITNHGNSASKWDGKPKFYNRAD